MVKLQMCLYQNHKNTCNSAADNDQAMRLRRQTQESYYYYSIFVATEKNLRTINCISYSLREEAEKEIKKKSEMKLKFISYLMLSMPLKYCKHTSEKIILCGFTSKTNDF